MIAQFLNDDFLLEAADDTRKELTGLADQRDRREAVDAGPLEEVTNDQVREVAAELDRAISELEERPDKQLKDSSMWMPREPILAIMQSELSRVSAEQEPDAFDADPEGPTERRIAEDPTQTGDGRRAWGAYEVTRPKIFSDPRWLWSGVVIGWYQFKDKAKFGGLPGAEVKIGDRARILLVGDWGSGLPRAQAVAREMRKVLDEGASSRIEQHVIHLGDVYYTGARREYEYNFLPWWQVREGEDIASYTLCGNHDMYRGGHAYYDTALTDCRFARQDGKSVFALGNDSWQLLALDTSYEDKKLSNKQAGWVIDRMRATPGRRTALLSHHQLWSAYEPAGDGFRKDAQSITGVRSVDAWFWAHEHRCLTYEPRDNIEFASCIGHGGIPEYLIADEGEPYPPGLRYDYRKQRGDGVEPWNTFGFAVVELDGRDMRIRYIDEDGNEHHQEHLP